MTDYQLFFYVSFSWLVAVGAGAEVTTMMRVPIAKSLIGPEVDY